MFSDQQRNTTENKRGLQKYRQWLVGGAAHSSTSANVQGDSELNVITELGGGAGAGGQVGPINLQLTKRALWLWECG